ncbi:MAG: hypothetical protein IT530_16445 [Burkholderiales bacterium]|nr:hypothetical protein [Burkholderiales bacterium]
MREWIRFTCDECRARGGARQSSAPMIALAGLTWSAHVCAETPSYPSRPVRYVVPFPAGASPDVIVRLITERFGHTWNQQVIQDAGIHKQ